MGNDGIREAVTGIHLFQPACLGDLLIASTFGLDMHRAHQPLSFGQGKKVFRQEITAQAVIVAEKKILVIVVLQPGITTVAQVPQVVVSIDNRQRILGCKVGQAVAFVQRDHDGGPLLSATRRIGKG